ncbi:MAG: hypothetical protein WCG20_00360 [bacterium]
MAEHVPAKTPKEVFDQSPVAKKFIGDTHVELLGAKREMALPADYPEDFVLRTILHFQQSGWDVEHDGLGKKLKFTAGKPKPPKKSFLDIFG